VCPGISRVVHLDHLVCKITCLYTSTAFETERMNERLAAGLLFFMCCCVVLGKGLGGRAIWDLGVGNWGVGMLG
jgi:hypothetical protein